MLKVSSFVTSQAKRMHSGALASVIPRRTFLGLSFAMAAISTRGPRGIGMDELTALVRVNLEVMLGSTCLNGTTFTYQSVQGPVS